MIFILVQQLVEGLHAREALPELGFIVSDNFDELREEGMHLFGDALEFVNALNLPVYFTLVEVARHTVVLLHRLKLKGGALLVSDLLDFPLQLTSGIQEYLELLAFAEIGAFDKLLEEAVKHEAALCRFGRREEHRLLDDQQRGHVKRVEAPLEGVAHDGKVSEPPLHFVGLSTVKVNSLNRVDVVVEVKPWIGD